MAMLIYSLIGLIVSLVDLLYCVYQVDIKRNNEKINSNFFLTAFSRLNDIQMITAFLIKVIIWPINVISSIVLIIIAIKREL